MTEELILNFDLGFVGDDLELWGEGLHLVIRDGVVEGVGRGRASGGNVVNFSNSLVMPPLANLHTHILDYIYPEIGWDLDIDSLVGEPYSVKYLMLSRASKDTLKEAINRFLRHSWGYGVGVIVEFREGGLTNTLLDYGLRPKTHLVFGMPVDGDVVDEVRVMSKYVDGVGISSPLYFSYEVLKDLGGITSSLGLQVHAHISEVEETYVEGDLKHLIRCLRPNAVVHGVFLRRPELELLKELGIPLIICLRSNQWFIGKLPDLKLIYEVGLDVGLGTDNASWVKGDLWRDLDLLTSLLRVKGVLDPKWVLRVATNSSVVGIDTKLREGSKANLLVINTEETSIKYARDKYLAVVKRGGPEGVEVLITDGVIRYCSERYEAVCDNLRNFLSRR
jgi:cytosine/adenosine deaminase-related metal-dependent hydrolase